MISRATGDSRRLPVRLLSLLAFVLFVTVASAAADTLQGRVLDPSGRPIAAAEVVLLRGQTVVATTVSSADGRYGPIALAPGRYDITVVAPGMRLIATTVTIAAGVPATRDLPLSLAAMQESVLVSAAQVDTTASRSASSTSVVTRADLDRLQVSSLPDALRLVPGFNTAPSGTMGAQTSIFPRGGESDYTLVLVDGVPQNAFGGAFDAAHLATANADRIEVVRGPQSALYGSGAIGGIVHVISASGGSPRATATLEGGGYGLRASTVQGTASQGAWSFGGGFDWLDTAGDTRTFDSVGGAVSNDDYSRVSAAGSVAWSDSPARRIRLDLRGGQNERGYPGPYGSDPEGLYAGLDTVSRGTNTHGSVGVDALLRSGAALDHRLQMTWSRADATFLSPWGESEDESGRLTGRYQLDAMVGTTGLSAGAEALRERALNTYITDDTFSPVPVRRSNLGLFVEARPELHDRVFTTLGVRTERIDRTELPGDGSRPAFDSSVVWSTNPKVAVSWLARSPAPGATSAVGDTRVRASAGTGIKAPTAFDIAFTDNPDLRPERSRSFDVGIEQHAWQSRVTLDATWFHNSYDDLIVTVSQPLSSASRYKTDNIANARSAGLEFGAALRLSSALSTRINWTWLDTEVLGVDSLPDEGFGVYQPGDELIRRPRHVASMDVGWTTPRWSASGLVHYRGQMRDLEPNWASSVYPNSGRATVSVGASVRLASSLEVYGRLTNALDDLYEDVLGFPAMGRSAAIGLRVAAGR
jgi:outer membrane cobalamin receptor